jgi:hypothetical protein
MVISLALEGNPVENDLADAPALRQAVVVVERVVDAGIEPGDGRFFRGLVKGVEGARGLRRRQLMIGEQRVGERDRAEHVGEDRGDGA